MSNRTAHQQLLRDLREKYQSAMNEKMEFTYDGPSEWNTWETEKLKILFLVKEARLGYHPCIPKQPTSNKFARNLARWKVAIKNSLLTNQKSFMPKNHELSKYNDDIAIVEVKKINEERRFSSNRQICYYANRDKEYLRQQINFLNPNVVVCCSTFSSYNIIYENTYSAKEKLQTINNCSSWLFDDRLVIDFFHPSTFHKSNEFLYDTIVELTHNQNVFQKAAFFLS